MEIKSMNERLAAAVKAHGGLDRWRGYNTVRAAMVSGGELLDRKAPQTPQPRQMTVCTKEQAAFVTPHGGPDKRSRYTPHRISERTSIVVTTSWRFKSRDDDYAIPASSDETSATVKSRRLKGGKIGSQYGEI
jgi:hypothetical protein